MEKLEFNLWIWFTPIVGFFYIIWFGFRYGFSTKLDDLFDAYQNPIWVVIVAQLYTAVHIYTGAILTAWILSLTNVI